MIVFYHTDLDGHCSAAVVRRKYPDAEFITINYGDKFPWAKIKDQEIIMVDFSLQPFGDMLRLAKECRSLLWIDHHKTAINEFEINSYEFLNGNCVTYKLDGNFAACELTWQHFFESPVNGEPMPRAVHLLGRYDIWKHDDPDTLPFQYGMRAQPTDMNDPDSYHTWDNLLGPDSWMKSGFISVILSEGKCIMRSMKKSGAARVRDFGFQATMQFGGLDYKCICMNTQPASSQMFESIWDPDKYDMMVAFGWKGNKWTTSLYSTREDIDCAALAKSRGGGGHKGAAGFQSETLADIGLILDAGSKVS